MQTEYEIITEGNILKLENGAIINRYTHVVKGAELGDNCMIGSFCYVGKDAKIGKNTRVQNHVSVFDGVDIGSNVFIGPHTVFTNYRNPQDRLTREEGQEFVPDKTTVGDNATICAGVVIIAPAVIGAGSRIGAGSVVLKDIGEEERKNGLIKNRGKEEQKKVSACCIDGYNKQKCPSKKCPDREECEVWKMGTIKHGLLKTKKN
jgi:UDP-2-acetamido-3-amino-2,3-dideoxy-glucuronate N-acetyltransferase